MNPRPTALFVFTIAGVTLNACSNSPTEPAYAPDIPTAWAATVTNTYFPLVRGTTFRYENRTADGLETIVVEVLNAPRLVNGVSTTAVHDAVFLEGVLIEDTYDWYAQDLQGNVWYLGEDSKSYDNGVLVNTEGSWTWNVDGALPGIIMWADPAAHIGEAYRQEYYRGEAEDWGRVVATGRAVTVPFGTFNACIETEDWNGLEPGPREQKFYCPQVGFVLETLENERVELVSVTTASRPGR